MANTLWRHRYTSMADALNVKASPANNDLLTRTLKSQSRGWYGPECDSAPAALRLFSKGWHDGAQRIAALKARELSAPLSIRRRKARADQGDELDIHRVYAGRIDSAWQTTRRTGAQGTRSVTIIAPINIACRYTTEEMFWRGAAIVKLCDLLSDAGYNVEIVGTIISHDVAHGVDIAHDVPLKASDQPLDTANLAAGLAHTGFFRSAGFAILASYKDRIDGCFGLNMPERVNALMARVAAEYAEGNDAVITIPYETLGQEPCEKWLNAQLERFCGE